MGRTGVTLALVHGSLTRLGVAHASPEADKLIEEGRKLSDSEPVYDFA
jgi:hypothetical protein